MLFKKWYRGHTLQGHRKMFWKKGIFFFDAYEVNTL